LTFGQPARSSHTNRQALILWAVPLLFLLFFFYLPLGAIFRYGLGGGAGASSYDLTAIWRPVGFTLFQAGLSTLLTLLIGLPTAYLFARFQFPGKRLLWVLSTLPFILPTVVVAASFNALAGPRGVLNVALMGLFGLDQPPIHMINTLGAILAAHVFYNTSIVIRMVAAAWARQDLHLVQAAQVLGASPLRTLREVTLPLLRPVILAASLLVFLFDFTSFGVVLLLGGPAFATIEVEIYTQALHMLNLSQASLLSIIQLGITLILTVVYSRFSIDSLVPVTPRSPENAERRRLSPSSRLIMGILIAAMIVLFASPLAALGARSVTRLEAERGQRGEVQYGLTLDYYRELFINRQGTLFFASPIEAARNSLGYAMATVIISVTLGFLAATALTRRAALNRWIDPLFMLPLGASAVTLGLGFILVFNRPPFNLGNSFLLLPVAHSLVALPFVVRTLHPALGSIPAGLRQAATVLGATPFRVWREVDLPIISRAALIAATFAFTISLGEFGATTFLARPEFPTLPVAIFRSLSRPGALNYGQAMAMATILMATCGLGILLIEKLRLPGTDQNA